MNRGIGLDRHYVGTLHWVFNIMKSAEAFRYVIKLALRINWLVLSGHVEELWPRAVVLITLGVDAIDQVEAHRAITNNERRKHTVIDSIRQFDRALLPCCS